jgi:hypothetical protein
LYPSLDSRVKILRKATITCVSIADNPAKYSTVKPVKLATLLRNLEIPVILYVVITPYLGHNFKFSAMLAVSVHLPYVGQTRVVSFCIIL